MYVMFSEFEKQVKQDVFLVLKNLFSTLSDMEFEELFLKDEWVAFMKRDIYLRYQEGEIPFLRVDSEKEEFVLGIVPSIKNQIETKSIDTD